MFPNQAIKSARAERYKRTTDGHDRLHLYRAGDPNYRNTGIKHCWCLCQKCFRAGKCICAACPCRGGAFRA